MGNINLANCQIKSDFLTTVLTLHIQMVTGNGRHAALLTRNCQLEGFYIRVIAEQDFYKEVSTHVE